MKRLPINIISMAASDVLRRVFGFAGIAYLARTLSVEGFGAVGVALTVLGYAVTISSGGLHMFGAREIAQGADNDLVGLIVSARVFNAVVLTAITWIAALLFVPDRRVALLIGVTASSSVVHGTFLEWYYLGKERMPVIGMSWTISAAVYLGVILSTVRSDSDLLWVGVAAVAGDITCGAIIWTAYIRGGGGVRFRFRFSHWIAVMQNALPIGIGSIIANLTSNLPLLVIGILYSTAEAGIYAAGFKLVFFLLMMDRILSGILLPASARIRALDPHRLEIVLNRALKILLVAGLPVCVGGTIVADDLLVFLFGAPYLASSGVFKIVLWYVVLTLTHTVYMSAVLAVGKDKAYGHVMVVSGILYATATLVFTALWGIMGAAAAVVVAEGLTLLVMRRTLGDSVLIRFPHRWERLALSLAGMVAALLAIGEFHVLVLILMGMVAYIALVLITGVLTQEEIEDLRHRFL